MREKEDKKPSRGRRPATSPENREGQLVALAYSLTEKRLRNGTATSQEIVHFLKHGTQREALEQERIRGENELIKAKIEDMGSRKRIEELYSEALSAMSRYQGRDELDFDD